MEEKNCYRCGQQGHWYSYCPLKTNTYKSLSFSPNIVKRMKEEKCYECGEQGHWSWYCPLKDDNSKSSYRNISPNIVKRMKEEKCYECGEQGHWSWYCPLKDDNNKSSYKNISPNIVKRMKEENCYKCGQKGHWSWYCPLSKNKTKSESTYKSTKSNITMVMERSKCDRCDQQGHLPWNCPVNHNNNITRSQRSKETSESSAKQEKELLNNPSTVLPINQSKQRPLHECQMGLQNDTPDNDFLSKSTRTTIMDSSENPSFVGFTRFEVADVDQQVTNLITWKAIDAEAFLSSRSSKQSRVRGRQSLFHTDILAAASITFGSFSTGWLGRLIYSHPTRSLKIPSPQPFFCCIFPSFDPIVVPKKTTSYNVHGEYNTTAIITLSTTIEELHNSKENSPTLEKHNKFLEEEKVRLAQIQNDFFKIEALLEASNEQRELLFLHCLQGFTTGWV